MDKDIVKLGKYLKSEIERAKEEILENMDARLDALEDSLSSYDEDEDDIESEQEDEEFSDFDDQDDEETEDEVDEPEEEEFDYSEDDLEPTKLPDDVENEVNKLAPEEQEIVRKSKFTIKKPRIIKNVQTKTTNTATD